MSKKSAIIYIFTFLNLILSNSTMLAGKCNMADETKIKGKDEKLK